MPQVSRGMARLHCQDLLWQSELTAYTSISKLQCMYQAALIVMPLCSCMSVHFQKKDCAVSFTHPIWQHACRESAHAHVDNDLPFELKALEAALTHAVLVMEEDALDLNKRIGPMLERLSLKVGWHKGCLCRQ